MSTKKTERDSVNNEPTDLRQNLLNSEFQNNNVYSRHQGSGEVIEESQQIFMPTYKPSNYYDKNNSYRNRGNGSSCCSIFGKVFLVLFFLGYIAGVLVLQYYLEAPVVFTSFILIVNFICLFFIGNYLLRGILFPYANRFIRNQLESAINRRFSTEFTRLIVLTSHMVKILGGIESIESYYEVKDELNRSNEQVRNSQLEDSSLMGDSSMDLRVDTGRAVEEINSKMAAVLDLIGMYSDINKEIIDQKLDKKGTTREFKRATELLSNIRDSLQKLPLKPMGSQLQAGNKIQQLLMSQDGSQNLWTYYKRDLSLSDSREYSILEAVNKKILPKIDTSSQETKNIIEDIEDFAIEFQQLIANSVRARRCLGGLCCKYKKMFGTIEQNQILLERNFDGKHFWVRGHKGAKLDCMFFPCTVEDKPDVCSDKPRGAYLDKPTFIMCNPNALLYQQMISSPNAYWLTFFLRREVNVLCWNYRNYGHSKGPKRCFLSFCDQISPRNIKRDAECIMDFLVNKLKVKGKIGVYGRSLGGIASTHLANRFPEKVSALLIDRTFSDLDISSERRLFGSWTRTLYKFVSCSWKAKNDRNFIEAKQCFKIAACDPLDDVVDNFSALPTGVAEKLATLAYSEQKWRVLFEVLTFIYEWEDYFNSSLQNENEVETSRDMIFQMVRDGSKQVSDQENQPLQEISNSSKTENTPNSHQTSTARKLSEEQRSYKQ